MPVRYSPLYKLSTTTAHVPVGTLKYYSMFDADCRAGKQDPVDSAQAVARGCSQHKTKVLESSTTGLHKTRRALHHWSTLRYTSNQPAIFLGRRTPVVFLTVHPSWLSILAFVSLSLLSACVDIPFVNWTILKTTQNCFYSNSVNGNTKTRTATTEKAACQRFKTKII